MKVSLFGFEYTWIDLQPVLVLAATILVAQIVGAIVGLTVAWHPFGLINVWMGGALATLPGFLAGLLIQSKVTPGRLSEHKVKILVCFFGLLALALFAFAIAIPVLGLFNVS